MAAMRTTPANSTTSSIDVSQASTSTSVTPSVNPVPLYTDMTYSATVSVDSPGSGTPSGTVDFTSDGTTIGTCSAVALSSGVARCTTEYFAGGPWGPIVATYSGGTDSTGSASSGFTENVTLGTSSTFASVSPSAVVTGASVTYSATVSGSLLTSPFGSVAFTIGNTDLCTAPLTGETALCTASNAPLGSDETVTATYSGDGATYEGSSNTTTLSVTPPDPFASGRHDGVGECCRRPWRHRHRRRGQGWRHRIRVGLRLAHRLHLWGQPHLGRGLGRDGYLLRRGRIVRVRVQLPDHHRVRPGLGQLTRLVYRELAGWLSRTRARQAVAWWPR